MLFANLFTIKQKATNMQKLIRSLRQMTVREEGATMVEYGLMVALIAVVCLIAVTALGVNIMGVFQDIAAAV